MRASDARLAFEQPTILIAHSFDMRPHAEQMRAIIERLSARLYAGRLQAYLWEQDRHTAGWGMQHGWQNWINGPAKSNCVGVFALLGERIGLTLPNDGFSRHSLQALGPVARALDLQLTLRKRPRLGELALTGTVHEILCSALYERDTLVFVRGDAKTLDRTLAPTERNFGFGVRAAAITKPSERRAHARQVEQLARFLDASPPGIRSFSDDRELEEHVIAFFEARCGLSARSRGSVFKSLSAYDIDDADVYFGRTGAIATLIDKLERAERAGRAPVMVVRGPPGDGKSSLCKAGITGVSVNLSKLKGQRRLFGATLHAGRVVRDALSGGRPALDQAWETLAMAAGPSKAALPAPLTQESFATSVEILLDSVVPGSGLVVVVDQFEEALALQKDLFDRSIAPLMSALDLLAKSGRARVVYVHPTGADGRSQWDDRRRLYTNLVQKHGDPAAADIVLTTSHGLQLVPVEAVAGMFHAGRVRAETSVVDAIVKSYETEFPASDSSALPYLSAFCAAIASIQEDRESESTSPPRAAKDIDDADRMLRSQSIGVNDIAGLSFKHVIEKLGEDALTSFMEDAQLTDDTIVGDLLDRLLNRYAGMTVAATGGIDWVTKSGLAPRNPALAALAQRLLENRILRVQSLHRLQLTHTIVLEAWSRARNWGAKQQEHLKWRADRLNAFTPAFARDPSTLLRDKDDLAAAERLLGSSLGGSLTQSERGLIVKSLVAVFENRAQNLGLRQVLLAGFEASGVSLLTEYCRVMRAWHARALGGFPSHELNARHGPLDAPVLHYAAWFRRESVARRLINLGADPSAVDADGASAIHVMAAFNGEPLLRRALGSTQQIMRTRATAQDHDRETPLFPASRWGRTENCRLLLACGASALDENISRTTSLHVACEYALRNSGAETTALAELLVTDARKKAPICGWRDSARHWTPLAYAARSGDIAFVRELLRDVSPRVLPMLPAKGGTPLHLAARHGRTEVVRTILEWAGAAWPWEDELHCNHLGRTALQSAISSKSADTVNACLSARQWDVFQRDGGGRSALGLACILDLPDVVRALLAHASHSPSIEDLDACLHDAASSGSTESAKLILDAMNASAPGRAPEAEPMLTASGAGYTAFVGLLLDYGAAIDCRDATRLTPLHHAARRGHVGAALYLIDRGASLAERTEDGRTPLHVAAFNGHTDVLHALLDHADNEILIAREDFGKTFLHCFFESLTHEGSETAIDAMIKRALDAGLTPDDRDNEGRNVAFLGLRYMLPAMCRFVERFPRLLEQRRDDGYFLAHAAAHHNNVDVLAFILDRLPDHANIEAQERVKLRRPVHGAVDGGAIGALELLRARGADFEARDAERNTPLLRAAALAQLAAFEYLLANGADRTATDQFGRNTLHKAGQSRNQDMWRLACERLPELANLPDNFGVTPRFSTVFFNAEDLTTLEPYLADGGRIFPGLVSVVARKGTPAQLSALLAAGGDVMERDTRGRPPHIGAFIAGNQETTEYLIRTLSAPQLEQAGGRTTLIHHAARRDNAEIIAMLYNRGVDLFDHDKRGMTPLHNAAADGSENALRLLLAILERSELDLPDERDRCSALQLAIRRGQHHCAAMLLAAGADPRRADINGKTALNDIAASDPSPSLLELKRLALTPRPRRRRLFEIVSRRLPIDASDSNTSS